MTEMLESERKYDVPGTAPLPALLEIPGVEHVVDAGEEKLDAVYFDTPAMDLAARRITLRRRTGGSDQGWHLKLPVDADQRLEIHAPLGQPDTVPNELLAHLRVYTRGQDLRPTAHLTTKRTTHRLYGPGAEHLADFADDRVHAEALQPGGSTTEWREWEIELVHAAERLFAAAEDMVTRAGARPSENSSKLARALGEAWPAERLPNGGKPRKKGPAVDVVTAYVGAQIDEMLAHDAGVRTEEPDAVHQMRSAIRRSRSALSTYRRLFKKKAARDLQAELKRLARILGQARDPEVMRDRLLDHLKELPDEHRTTPVRGPIEHELGTAYDTGYRRTLEALESGRYYRLLDSLEDFRDHPPVKPRASRPARKVTAKLVDRNAKRLDRAHKAVDHSLEGTDRDAALHQVRKDAKRLRHAAESATVVHGKRAPKVAKTAKRLQGVLGDHQDSVMARALLRSLTADPDLPGSTADAYRRLHEMEEEIAADAAAKYLKARRKSYGTRLR